MSEYIEREAALSKIELGEYYLKDILRDIPAADVAPVRHGRWIRYKDIHENVVKYICPFCADYTAFREDPGKYTVRENYIYCRKCGAKMDGGDDDE